MAVPGELPEVRASPRRRRRGLMARSSVGADAARAGRSRRRLRSGRARRRRGHRQRRRLRDPSRSRSGAREATSRESSSAHLRAKALTQRVPDAHAGADRAEITTGVTRGITRLNPSRIVVDVCVHPRRGTGTRRLTGSELRLAAAERFAAAPMPTPDEEIWRYSRIDQARPRRSSNRLCRRPRSTGPDGLDRSSSRVPDLFADETPDVFAELNRAFMSPTVIRVPAGRTIAEPIVVTHTVSGSGTAVFPRLSSMPERTARSP